MPQVRHDTGPFLSVEESIVAEPQRSRAPIQGLVGIAMGTGTDVAMRSAGVTLVKGDLRGISKAIGLSRATRRNIGLLLSPIIAGAAMSLSSLSVVGNALRLRTVKL